MADKKITKKEMFGRVIALVELLEELDLGLEIDFELSELTDFATHEIELLEKKSSTKSKKEKEKDVLDEKIKESILLILEAMETPMSASEILKRLVDDYEDISIQKVSALLKKMCEEESPVVEKFIEKRKSFFKLV